MRIAAATNQIEEERVLGKDCDTYLYLVACEVGGLDAAEEEVENLEREGVPLVEQRVVRRV